MTSVYTSSLLMLKFLPENEGQAQGLCIDVKQIKEGHVQRVQAKTRTLSRLNY